VIFGRHWFVVHLVTNIILSYFIIAPILFGLFHFILCLRRFLPFCILSRMFACSFMSPSRVSSAKMVTGLITHRSAHCSSQMVCHSACRALTLPSRMDKPNVLFAQSTTFFAHFCSRSSYLLLIGLKLSIHPLIISICQPTKTLGSSTPFLLYTTHT
jgi:hypothetical protein